jgi:5-(carboxyamino)imidazole ribonucleotide synthase
MKTTWNSGNLKLGIVGGGQLGRMFIQEAINYDLEIHVLDGDLDAPCKHIAHSFTHGSITDFEAVLAFGSAMDVITVEIENVSVEALEELEKRGKKVFPQPSVLRIIRDKGIQKQFYLDHQIPTAEFLLMNDKSELESVVNYLPAVQKMRTGGYDGKGVQILRTKDDFAKAFDVPSILEKMIPFEKEISVIVARNESGETKSFPAVECEFNSEENLVEFLFAPADIMQEVETKATEIAIDIITKLDMIGILAVEFFLLPNGELLVNEIAPRPHNSGHHTIECNYTSQFEQHMRAILNLPLGSTDIILPGVMINLLGESGFEGEAIYEGMEALMGEKGVYIHLYGKKKTKSFRKMGHLTVALPDLEQAKKLARDAKCGLRILAEKQKK